MSAKASDPKHALSKLSEVVRILATHPGVAHERLQEALKVMASVSQDDFVLEARVEYDTITAELEQYAGPGGVGYAIDSDVVARSLAGRLIDLWHFHHDELYGPTQP